MHKSMRPICIALVLSLGLYGCSMQSEEDALDSAVAGAEGVFASKKDIETNEKTSEFQFYLPQSLSVKEESENNIILSNGDNTYTVFYNNLEDPESKLNYESAKDDKALVYESFEDENKFGYLQILPSEDSNYQIQAGVGGVKITTYTKKKDMEEKAEQLMKIARSITEKDD